ncbi:universal stress protein (plasmid) [Pantoea sp. JZ29]|uniref:universal stress protein n=1 Tax=Pantoea sp. JZ29 TaxID=2654192 RepID=UPI002B465DCA|nr:universal stress protein [Pantoea sp. JZ29]WRH23463.1 universal stress protein [Pantoea sp. JZ29]
MKRYTHALVLVHGRKDGEVLVNTAAALACQAGIQITLAHVSDDYRMMNYVSDSLMDDVVAEAVIGGQAMLNALAASMPENVETRELVTMHRFEDVEKCIAELGIDLVIAGHRNRFMGQLTSGSLEYVNHLNTDVLVTHLPQ